MYPTGGISDSGVYPLEVDLRSASDESLAHFVTHVVVAPVTADGALTVGVPLQVAWVWPLRADPSSIGGKIPVNPTTLADLEPTGRLGRQATQVAADTDVPLTLAPSPETLEAWNALGAEVTRRSPRARPRSGPPGPRVTTRCSPVRTCRSTSRRSNDGGLGGVVNPRARPRRHHARGVLRRPPRPEHRAPRTARPDVARHAADRQRPPARASTAPSSRPRRRSTPPRTPTRCRRCRATTPARSRWSRPTPGSSSSSAATTRRRCAPRTSSPDSRSSPVSNRASSVGSRSRTPTGGTPTTRSSAETLAGLRGNPLVHAERRSPGCSPRCRWRPSTASPTAAPRVPPARALRRRRPRRSPSRSTSDGAGDHVTRSPACVGTDDPRTISADRDLARSVSADWANPAGRVRAPPAPRLDRHVGRRLPPPDRGAVAGHHHHHVEQGRDPDQLQEHQRPGRDRST